jgi:phytoene synthase
MDHFAYCEKLVREADKDRFLAALFAPERVRRQLFALYAFAIEIARVRESVSDPAAGEIRLQWWREVLGGTRASEARGHPPAAALFDTIVRAQLPVPRLVGLIEARRFDLYDEPMQDRAALEEYARDTSSVLIELGAHILDGPPAAAVSAAADSAGKAYAIAGLLRAFTIHAARRQLYIPLDILRRHGARVEDVFATRATAEVRAALTEMRELARSHFDAYTAHRASLPAVVAPAFLPVALVPIYLKRFRGANPFRRGEVAQWRRQWTLWRAARRQ